MSRGRFSPAFIVAVSLVLSSCGEANQTPEAASSSATAAPSGAASVEPTAAATDSPYAGLWVDATGDTIGATGDWTNKVEIADVDGDADLDLLFANGAAYETAGPPVASQVFLNQGAGQPFEDATQLCAFDRYENEACVAAG